MCAKSIMTSTKRGGIQHVQRLFSSIYPRSWSPFPSFVVFNVTETRQQLGADKKAGNKNINKPNYTRVRSLFCVQTTPRLPLNGQGPHTDPCCSLTWYDPEKQISCDWSLFPSCPPKSLHIISCFLMDQLKIEDDWINLLMRASVPSISVYL